MKQCAQAVLMVRPAHFFVDPDTAASNRLQSRGALTDSNLLPAAQAEFDGLGAALERAGIQVCTVAAPQNPALPDALFPNNWFSTHDDGTVILYPMLAPLRRLERRAEVLEQLQSRWGFRIAHTVNLSGLEASGEIVEGTGSLVLDRRNRLAFAALSPRTTARGVHAACEALGYRPIVFHARHADGAAIYHTNVMLSIGAELAVGCFESIADAAERASVLNAIEATRRVTVSLAESQMLAFAANCLELSAADKTQVLVFSSGAWDSLRPPQRSVVESRARICLAEIPVIERFGGGGVRCMLAEVFLPTLQQAPKGP